MSSYFLLWHETRPISIRRGSIFILKKYWLLSPWNRNIFFFLRFEIVQFGQWIFIHDKEKIQALSTHLHARLKMYIMNRSFQFKALLTLNAIPIGFFIIIFFSFCRFLLYFYRWYPYAVYWCSWNYILFSFFAFYQTSNHNSHIQAKIFYLKDGRKCISSCLFSKLKDQASLINVNTHQSKFSIQNFYSKSC